MSEPKVLHEWSEKNRHFNRVDGFRILEGGIFEYQRGGSWWREAFSLAAALREILRLSVENEEAKGNDVVFSCPSCGTPSAQTIESHLDIHPGATYTCDNCEGRVVFEALTTEQYTGRSTDAARARAEGRLEGMQKVGLAIGRLLNKSRRASAIQAKRVVYEHLAAAERELADRKEDGDVVG